MTQIDPMLRVTREITVTKSQAEVWTFVSDMGHWAAQMPGYISHEATDRDHSVWTLQVDIGPFQRPVPVAVEVLRWNQPAQVEFRIRGKEDPFIGEGSFSSTPHADGTRIVLAFGAQPTGSMARLLVPLVPPILSRTADEFSANLRRALEGGNAQPMPAQRLARRSWWRRLIDRFFGPKPA